MKWIILALCLVAVVSARPADSQGGKGSDSKGLLKKLCGLLADKVAEAGPDDRSVDEAVEMLKTLCAEFHDNAPQQDERSMRPAPTASGDQVRDGERLVNGLGKVCGSMKDFAEKYFADEKRGEEEWTDIFIELSEICMAAFDDDEDKRSTDDKEMEKDGIKMVMGIVRLCQGVGAYVGEYGVDTGDADADAILGGLVEVCMDVKAEMDSFKAENGKAGGKQERMAPAPTASGDKDRDGERVKNGLGKVCGSMKNFAEKYFADEKRGEEEWTDIFIELSEICMAAFDDDEDKRSTDDKEMEKDGIKMVMGIVRLCQGVGAYVGEYGVDTGDADADAILGGLVEVCMDVKAEMDSFKAENGKAGGKQERMLPAPTASGDKDRDGERVKNGLGKVCGSMKNFAEKYFADEKRGEEEWTNIFIELSEICMAAFGDDEDKRSNDDKEMEKDGIKMVMGIVRLCQGVGAYVGEYGVDTGDADADAILGGLVEVCMDVKAEMDSIKAENGKAGGKQERMLPAPTASGDKDRDGERVKAGLGKVCGSMKNFAEKYFADEKRGEEEWTDIFIELSEICMAAFDDDEDKRSTDDKEMEKDGIKMVMGIVRLCQGVGAYVGEYGVDTGDADADAILGGLVEVCMDVKAEMDSFKAENGKAGGKQERMLPAPTASGDKDRDVERVKNGLGKVCGSMKNFAEKYFADEKRGEEEWTNIFIELSEICMAAFGNDEDKRSTDDKEMEKDGIKMVMGIVRLCQGVGAYVGEYGVDTGDAEADAILGGLVEVCMDVKAEMDSFKAENGKAGGKQDGMAPAPTASGDKDRDVERVKNGLGKVCGSMKDFAEKYFADEKRGEEEWTNIFIELSEICMAAFGDDEDKRSTDDKEMEKDGIQMVMGIVRLCQGVGAYVGEYGVDTGDADADAILGGLVEVCMDVKAEMDSFKAENGKAGGKQERMAPAPTASGDKDRDGDRLKNGLGKVCGSMKNFAEKYFADEKRGEEEWTDIFIELSEICMAAFDDDEDKRSTDDKEMEKDGIKMVMGIVRLCQGVGAYVGEYGVDTGDADADAILGGLVEVCMDVKAEMDAFKQDKPAGKKERSMSGDMLADEEKLEEGLMAVCGMMQTMFEKYSGNDKRGSDAWDNIFMELGAVCTSAYPEVQDKKRSADDQEKQKDGMKMVMAVVKLCGGVGHFVEEYGVDTGDDDTDAMLGGLVAVCMDVKAELDSHKKPGQGRQGGKGKGGKTERGMGGKAPVASGDKGADTERLAKGLEAVCGQMKNFVEKYAQEDKRGADEWESIFMELGAICMAGADADQDKRSTDEEEMKKDGIKMVMGIVRLCQGVGAYVGEYGVDTGDADADAILGGLVEVCLDVKTEMDSFKEACTGKGGKGAQGSKGGDNAQMASRSLFARA